MLITDKLIFLEMEKTGSTHINYVLSECFPVERIGKHTRIESYVDGYKTDKFLIGSVRNPWDWYVSLWAQGCKGSGKSRLKGALYNGLTTRKLVSRSFFWNDSRDFSLTLGVFGDIWNEMFKPIDSWRETYENYESPELFRKWLKLILEERCHDIVRIWPSYIKRPLPSTFGLMTYKYCSYFLKNFPSKNIVNSIKNIDDLKVIDKRNNILDRIVKVEDLEDDLIKSLQAAGYDIDSRIINVITKNKSNKINTSSRLSTEFYYDDETVALVESKEKFIIDKYSYVRPIV